MVRGTDCTDAVKMYRTPVQEEFPDELTFTLQRESALRYGENPNQPAALYRFKGISIAELTNIRSTKSGKGGISAINMMDVTRAMEVLKFFLEVPAFAVMKHTIPAGFSAGYAGWSLCEQYAKTRDVDRRSAFGSIVVCNRPIDRNTAKEITHTYVEVVAAPEYEEGAMGFFEKKPELRTVLFSNLDRMPKFAGDDTCGLYDMKILPTGRVVVQRPFLSSIRRPLDLVCDPLVGFKEGDDERDVVVERDPTSAEIRDMLTAWYVNAAGVRSNGIVFVREGVTIAIGTGQQERVGAVEQAIRKAYQKQVELGGRFVGPLEGIQSVFERSPLEGAVMSSDGFFPFRDSIDLVAKHGVAAVVQPGGSKKDHEVIQAVNEHKMAMAFTLERCFGHF